MIGYSKIKHKLVESPKTWLITGVAGFIGSNILEELLNLNQKVMGLDNFSTGYQTNLDYVRSKVSQKHWDNFKFIEGDLCNLSSCDEASHNVDYILHQAALGSVPRSIKNPINSNIANVNGFLNILDTARRKEIKSFTYASSSSVYGDHTQLPKVEETTGNPLSTYALTKSINESYASVFSLNYSFDSIGLRYFNVFGKRQDPSGEYAAVIPRWVEAMIAGQEIQIYGDGSTSRDFCYIDNVVQMNILSALSDKKAKNQVYNVANGQNTTLLQLFEIIKNCLHNNNINYSLEPEFVGFREGDVKHSLANISKAQNQLGYEPEFNINNGLEEALRFYLDK